MQAEILRVKDVLRIIKGLAVLPYGSLLRMMIFLLRNNYVGRKVGL